MRRAVDVAEWGLNGHAEMATLGVCRRNDAVVESISCRASTLTRERGTVFFAAARWQWPSRSQVVLAAIEVDVPESLSVIPFGSSSGIVSVLSRTIEVSGGNGEPKLIGVRLAGVFGPCKWGQAGAVTQSYLGVHLPQVRTDPHEA